MQNLYTVCPSLDCRMNQLCGSLPLFMTCFDKLATVNNKKPTKNTSQNLYTAKAADSYGGQRVVCFPIFNINRIWSCFRLMSV